MKAILRMLVLLAILSSPFQARAHEVQPAIADMSVAGDRLTIDLRLNAEAVVAGIDLDGLANTDTAAEAGRYDALRALDPASFAAELRAVLPGWLETVTLEADGEVLPLTPDEIAVDPVAAPDLPRETRLRLSAALPSGASHVALVWPQGAGALVLRQQGVAEPFTGLLSGGDSSGAIPLAGGEVKTGWDVFVDYVPVGFDHILPKGLDHILFVLGLFFLSTRLGPLLWQVTAFTLAHTVTLALGALGLVNIPGSIVEPLIAASIVYVAVENIYRDGLSRWRPMIVFGFGLLHGLGFASVLGDFGLPAGQFIPALIGFNIGVELGQLTVIAIAYLAVGAWFGSKSWYRTAIAIPASGLIALVGAYWFVERVFL